MPIAELLTAHLSAAGLAVEQLASVPPSRTPSDTPYAEPVAKASRQLLASRLGDDHGSAAHPRLRLHPPTRRSEPADPLRLTGHGPSRAEPRSCGSRTYGVGRAPSAASVGASRGGCLTYRLSASAAEDDDAGRGHCLGSVADIDPAATTAAAHADTDTVPRPERPVPAMPASQRMPRCNAGSEASYLSSETGSSCSRS